MVEVVFDKILGKIREADEGSGGGTSYENLKNKPSVNGVELSGDKTSNELGIYSKPSGGIPESDLSSDVQQALQKHFKGWYASSSALPANPVVGDYAYVKGASSTDPAAIYECITAGSWSDSGRTADTSNVQTFASGEEVNEVSIINNIKTGGFSNILSAEALKEIIPSLFSLRAKNAILAVFKKVAYSVPDVSSEIEELENALFNLDEFVGISAVYTQGTTVIWDSGVSTLTDIKRGLVVTAEYGDGLETEVLNYTLSGTLTAGVSVVTVEYQGFTATINVTVTAYGSKTSYVLSDGIMLGRAFGNLPENYGWVIQQETNNRKHYFLQYGLDKMLDINGNPQPYYGVPVPPNASSVTVSITSNTLMIGGYFIAMINGKWTQVKSNQSYVTGTYTKAIEAVAGQEDFHGQTYLVVASKPASGNFSADQPSALTIEFTLAN